MKYIVFSTTDEVWAKIEAVTADLHVAQAAARQFVPGKVEIRYFVHRDHLALPVLKDLFDSDHCEWLELPGEYIAIEAEQSYDEMKIRAALREYHAALDRRKHVGIAGDKLIKSLEKLLNAPWVMDATMERSEA